MFCRDGTVEDEVWMRLLEPYRQGLAVGNHDRSLPAVKERREAQENPVTES
jgi:hypothetical protein